MFSASSLTWSKDLYLHSISIYENVALQRSNFAAIIGEFCGCVTSFTVPLCDSALMFIVQLQCGADLTDSFVLASLEFEIIFLLQLRVLKC
jgi:hypothetical protein